ncbi:hypothetical protein QBC37DRAFT_481476 [Rhypophila decipiens]|uniref:RNase MRP protein 1 RNA binding domain-containing protein n=1 Tax=Rhypophila decipiens TaxID=261697 RepID=A0AAN6YCK3_9PEZI|nr:hypothetical protein QBC37DRAFT_481476 [Rhypophila decipiens]
MSSSTLLPSSQRSQKPTQNKKQTPDKQQQKAKVGGQDNTNETEKEKEDEFQNRPRQKAINSLEPALHILERFHHRNKNQHRRSKWWAEADMLRRQVKKFIEALYDGLEEEERANKILARASKNPATGMKMKGKSGKENDLGDGLVKDKFGIYERGVYLRGLLVPRAWLAFSQVVADERFAQLGLMLLATLAQVDQVVSAFAPGPDVDEEDDDLDDLVDSARNQEISSVRETAVIEDVGVAISREEFIMTTMSVRTGGASAQGGERKTRERTIISVETDGDVDDDGEFEGFDDDAPSSMLDPVSTYTNERPATAVVEEEASTMESTNKKTKKKRPRNEEEEEQLSREEGTEDDDIGSIFSSLIPTTKKKKRSSKAATGGSVVSSSKTLKASVEEEPSKLDDDSGDEIGSIFSSLIPKTTKKKSSTPASASASTPTTTTTSKIKTKSKEKEKEKKKKKKRQDDEFDDIFGGLV